MLYPIPIERILFQFLGQLNRANVECSTQRSVRYLVRSHAMWTIVNRCSLRGKAKEEFRWQKKEIIGWRRSGVSTCRGQPTEHDGEKD
jgi:hypothetical protein